MRATYLLAYKDNRWNGSHRYLKEWSVY